MTGILYSDYLISVFFTDDYRSGGLTLQLLCLSLIPMSYVRVLTTGVLISMDMTSKMYRLVNVAFLGSIISGLLILAFPRADIGAAASRLAAECLFAGISYIVVAKRVRVLTPGVLGCVLPGAAFMALIRALVPERYAPAGIAASYASFFIVYLVAVYYTRLDDLKSVFRVKGPSAGTIADEQILIGKEET
jgi:O-antigen/teichoic acid export membrane protein